MNLVQLAMRRPFMVVVLVLAMVLAAALAIQRMPRDIFPDMGVPTIYVAQPYGGMDPAQMEGYIVNYYEYHFLYINGIEHVESKSIQGAALIKLQFHPGTDMAAAMAETIGYINRARAFMPTGTVPPFAMRFDAGSVPVGNLVFSSDNLTLGELQYNALFRVRPLFATLPGVSAPPPFGGSSRAVVIKLDPERLRAYNMSPEEVVTAINATNVLTPSGNAIIGDSYPMVSTNAVVTDVKELESVPLRAGTTQTVFLRDVGTVEDGSDIQTAYALVNGRRTVYIPVTKRSDASTLAVVDLVKKNLPKFQAALPAGVKVEYAFDQSPNVTRAIRSLLLEIALGALLTGMMILLFLRDWRSATIVVLNIPVSLLCAVLVLWISGQTVNIMTLGGLALAVGILVDEATVSIENIHTHLGRRRPLALAAFDATTETIVPRFLAMLCILAVFIPALFMVGAAKSLFVPLSLAVGFSMVASYILSSTLVPVLSVWFLRRHAGEVEAHAKPGAFRTAYGALAGGLIRLRWLVLPAYLAFAAFIVLALGSRLGIEIFPLVDAGQLQMRLKAPTGTRIDETEKIALKTLDIIKEDVGADNIEMTLGFVGVHASSYPINLIHLWTGGPEEAVLQVQLKHGAPVRIAELQERLRSRIAAVMPKVRTSFEPSDIVSRVMSFGAPTPIEVAVTGPELPNNQAFADKIKDALAKIPSLRDLNFAQASDYPTIKININRERAGIMGLSVADVTRSVITATYSSRFVTPIYWADPKTGIGFQIQVQIPQTSMNSFEQIQNIPVNRKEGQMLLRDVADVTGGVVYGQIDRYNMQRSITLNANIVGEDLGSVSRKVTKAIEALGAPPAKVSVALRGQIPPMQQMVDGLQKGFLLAVLVIFLLLAANFQSFKLAFIVILTIPAVAAGIVVALWVTGTTLNLQSFMGAIMAVGVAVANAILLVTFAERARLKDGRAGQAAVEGASSRLRPILMTTLAMIAGMIPMALGLGEGGDQTAPLGRAVIGGLAASTLATLFVLPGIFAIVRARSTTAKASIDPYDPESEYFERLNI